MDRTCRSGPYNDGRGDGRMPAVSVRDASDAPVGECTDRSATAKSRRPLTRGTRRGLGVAALLACAAAAVVGIALSRSSSHGDPDPGGRTFSALQPVESAVPDGVAVLVCQEARAQWSSCDGRPGTFGWTDITVVLSFTTTTPANVLISQVNDTMTAIGWIPGPPGSSQLGPDLGWTRTLDDGTQAHALLSPGTADNGLTITWELAASAPPNGQRASGC